MRRPLRGSFGLLGRTVRWDLATVPPRTMTSGGASSHVSRLSASWALSATRIVALPRFSTLTVCSATFRLSDVCGVTVAEISANGRMVRLPATWLLTLGSALELTVTTKAPVPAIGFEARGGRNRTRAVALVLGISRSELGSTDAHERSTPPSWRRYSSTNRPSLLTVTSQDAWPPGSTTTSWLLIMALTAEPARTATLTPLQSR